MRLLHSQTLDSHEPLSPANRMKLLIFKSEVHSDCPGSCQSEGGSVLLLAEKRLASESVERSRGRTSALFSYRQVSHKSAVGNPSPTC